MAEFVSRTVPAASIIFIHQYFISLLYIISLLLILLPRQVGYYYSLCLVVAVMALLAGSH
jgi:hypothetical protein